MQLLQQRDIDCIVEDYSKDFDPSFALNEISKVYEVKVAAIDFEKVTQLLHFMAQEAIDKVPESHYLHEFSSEELISILKEPDLWGDYDYVAAQLILRARGEPVNEIDLQTWRTERIELLKKPKHAAFPLLLADYTTAILGGFVGLIIGYLLMKQLKVLPNGERVAYYDAYSQKQGKTIVLLSIIFLLIYISLSLYFNPLNNLTL